MKLKSNRIETLKMLISSKELGSQEEVLSALAQEGYSVTQATLSRDFKQLKVAKAASMNGKYVYVLPNETMYKRVPTPRMASEMLRIPGYRSIRQFSRYPHPTWLCQFHCIQHRQWTYRGDYRHHRRRRYYIYCH